MKKTKGQKKSTPHALQRGVDAHGRHIHGKERAVTISKTYQFGGHWIEKPNTTPIVVCPCGNKYLKTRAGQLKCLRCLSRTAALR